MSRRRDLLDSVAVIVSLPLFRENEVESPGPSLGGIWALYGYGPGTPEEELAREFFDGFRTLVAHATSELADAKSPEELAVRPYDIGPDAGGLPDVIVTVIQDARPILEVGSLLWTLGQATLACRRGFKSLVKRLGVRYPGPDSPLIFTEPMILGVCYAHVRDMYHPKATIEIRSFVRSSFPDYGDPEHPGGMEYYLVQARVGRKSYVYAIDSHATVSDHYLIEGQTITMLALPDLDDAGYLPREHGRPIRRVKVDPSSV